MQLFIQGEGMKKLESIPLNKEIYREYININTELDKCLNVIIDFK